MKRLIFVGAVLTAVVWGLIWHQSAQAQVGKQLHRIAQ